jgi:hypothetical protein
MSDQPPEPPDEPADPFFDGDLLEDSLTKGSMLFVALGELDNAWAVLGALDGMTRAELWCIVLERVAWARVANSPGEIRAHDAWRHPPPRDD